MSRSRFRLGARLAVLLPSIALLLAAGAALSASSGDLDASFGTEGVAIAPFGESSAASLARQPDGKLVAAGSALASSVIAVARFDANGVLDPTFGGDGMVTTDVGPLGDLAADVMVHTDGTIVVVGDSRTSETSSSGDIVVIRYLADGSPDPDFADAGIAVNQLGLSQKATAGAIQPDGKILVVGSTQTMPLTRAHLFVVRYDTDGVLDQSFGDQGLVTLDFGDRSDGAAAVVVQPDGAIVVAGTSFNGPDFDDGSVATLTRLDSSGVPDPTFGSGGSVVVSTHPNNVFKSLVLQPDGQLVVLGGTGTVGVTHRLFRYDSSGVPDPTFVGAVLPVVPQANTPRSLALLPDGKFGVRGDFSGRHSAVARMNANGSVDASFGMGGSIEVALGVTDRPLAIVAAPGGDMLLAGPSSPPDGPRDRFEMTVARVRGASDACAIDSDCGVCERCGVSNLCEIGPRAGCTDAAPRAAQIKLKQKYGRGDRLIVKWRGTVPSFDPTLDDDVGTCLFQNGDRRLLAIALAGGTCGGPPCWTPGAPTGFEYNDPTTIPHGIRSVDIEADRLKLGARGVELTASPQGMPEPFSLGTPPQSPVLLQIQASNGACMEATFDAERKVKPNLFRAKND